MEVEAPGDWAEEEGDSLTVSEIGNSPTEGKCRHVNGDERSVRLATRARMVGTRRPRPSECNANDQGGRTLSHESLLPSLPYRGFLCPAGLTLETLDISVGRAREHAATSPAEAGLKSSADGQLDSASSASPALRIVG